MIVPEQIVFIKDLGIFNIKARMKFDVEMGFDGNNPCIKGKGLLWGLALSDIDPSFYEAVRYKPKDNEEYVFVNDMGKIGNHTWNGDERDERLYNFYNVFPDTSEGVKHAISKRDKILAVLKEGV